MTREEFEAVLTPALFRYLEWVARGIGGDLADDAVQDALATFKYEKFDLEGSAKLTTYLIQRISWRALNLKTKNREYTPLNTIDAGEPWVKPWDDYKEQTGELLPDEPDPTRNVDDLTSDDDDQDLPNDYVSAELAFLVDEWQQYHDAHPQEHRQALQEEYEWECRLNGPPPEDARERNLSAEDDDDGSEADVLPDEERHVQIVKALKRNYKGPKGRRPPGAGYAWCDYVHVHKYGYPALRLTSCPLCRGNDPAIGETRGTREAPVIYSPSLEPACLEARKFVRAFKGMIGIQPARHIYGVTRPALLEAPDATCWAGDDYAMHFALSQLSAEESGLLWLLNQGYLQEEINEADSISDPYARALAQPFNGIGQYKISREYRRITERLAVYYKCARLFPAPHAAKRIARRTAQRIKAYAVPADKQCRYCGGLLLQTWVDERWRRLLDEVGVDPAYLAKRCSNCGDLIDCLTLKRRPKDYRQSEEVPDGFRKLTRQYTLIWEAVGVVSLGLPVKDRGGSNHPRQRRVGIKGGPLKCNACSEHFHEREITSYGSVRCRVCQMERGG